MAENGVDLLVNQNVNPMISNLAVQNRQLKLLGGVTANDVGVWRKKVPFAQGALEVTAGGALTGSLVSLFVSNAEVIPANGWTITIGGSKTTGDTVSIELNIGPYSIVGTYTAVAGDTLNSIAAGLALSLQTSIAYTANDLSANDNPSRILFENFQVSATNAVITAFYQADINQPVSLDAFASSGATETLTVAQYDDGSGFEIPDFAAVTATGMYKYNCPATWFKAKVTNYNATAGAISAIVQEILP